VEEKDKKVYLKDLAFISTVFNESGALIPFLASLVKQAVMPSEIILVDGGSTDDTLAIITDFFKVLKKTQGFEAVTVFEEASGNSFKPMGHEAGNGSVALPLSCNAANDDGVLYACKAVKDDIAGMSGYKAVKNSEKTPGDIDYSSEKLVFESILNGVTRVKIYDAPGANISSGRNIAIKNAKSKFICVSDAGCRLSPDWIEEISKYFTGNPADTAGSEGDYSTNPDCITDTIAADSNAEKKCGEGNCASTDVADTIVAGGYNLPYIENFLQACLAVCVLPVKSEISRSKYMPSSRNICFAKAAWEKAGGYPKNMDFGEDMRFNFNLKALGYRIRFNPDALVYWNLRNNPAAIFRQFFRYAKGDAVGRMYSHRHIIRFASVFLFAALIMSGALISPWFFLAILLLFAAFIYRPYFRINYFLNDKNCCVFTENKKTLFFIKLKTIFCIPVMLTCIETAKLAGYIYGLFIRKNY
ncbi:MAG TPA: glycosyltransferase, partial [Candidatus Humimicrobiaceae bacterium]